ncbi:MAG: diaminopimelate epimerase, partial [Gemmatimonadales bacterium]
AAPAAVPGLHLAAGERQAALAVVGVPHLVVQVDDLEQVNLPVRGRALRGDPALGPGGGANVNFIAPAGPRGGRNWLMRTYERGVEAETLACGTGAVAAACAIQEWGLGASPVHILTRSGRELVIRVTKTAAGGYDDAWLIGEGRMVLRGVLT